MGASSATGPFVGHWLGYQTPGLAESKLNLTDQLIVVAGGQCLDLACLVVVIPIHYCPSDPGRRIAMPSEQLTKHVMSESIVLCSILPVSYSYLNAVKEIMDQRRSQHTGLEWFFAK